MVQERIRLIELDRFWYTKLHDALPSGEIRAIGRFAFGILKEMVKLSSMGYEEFPSSDRGYIFEKVMSIIRRTRIEDEVLKEILRYMGKEELTAVKNKIREISKTRELYGS